MEEIRTFHGSKFQRAEERNDWDAQPNPPTLFQIAADKLREAEFLRLRRIAQYNFLWTFKGNRSRAKKILFETEDDFRDRICDQVLTRPHTKVLL
jgi:hypothetical protein